MSPPYFFNVWVGGQRQGGDPHPGARELLGLWVQDSREAGAGGGPVALSLVGLGHHPGECRDGDRSQPLSRAQSYVGFR